MGGHESVSRSRPAPVPGGAEIADMAGRFSFPEGVGTAIADAADECRTPAVSEDLARAQHTLLEREPGLDLLLYRWPEPPSPLFYAVALMSLVPEAEDRYRRRGIAEAVVNATLWDIGQQVDVYRRIHGHWGISAMSWLAHHVQARIAHLGRLQFALDTHWFEPAPGLALRPGDPVLGVHIPEDGPFPPEACDAAFARAADFFAADYPEFEWRGFTCVSWLLDPELARRLPAASNIVAFQRRFTRQEAFRHESEDAVTFTFRTTETEPDRLPTDTPLQRVVVDHLRSGGTWDVCAGSIDR